jgi:hypothetical protein
MNSLASQPSGQEHKEKAKELMEFTKNMKKHEKEAGVKTHGFYLRARAFTSY